MTILDYGRPARPDPTRAAYAGYGVIANFTSNKLFNDQIVYLTEQYAIGYFNAIKPVQGPTCPVLLLAIGTKNSYQCRNSPGCVIRDAGRRWGEATETLRLSMQRMGYGANILIAAADDIENNCGRDSDGDFVWDNPVKTKDFISGYLESNPGNSAFIGYNDAGLCAANGWNATEAYMVAQGMSPAIMYPLPQIYFPHGGTCNWTEHTKHPSGCPSRAEGSTEGDGGAMFMLGALTECEVPLAAKPGDYQTNGTGGGCDVFDSETNMTRHEYGPEQAWEDLFHVQTTFYLARQGRTLDYSVNIVRLPTSPLARLC